MAIRARPYENEDDLRRMQALQQELWALEGPRVQTHVGDLACVLEAPDGTFAAYVLCWYDDENRVGEFEPVGTHPNQRRRGFGRRHTCVVQMCKGR